MKKWNVLLASLALCLVVQTLNAQTNTQSEKQQAGKVISAIEKVEMDIDDADIKEMEQRLDFYLQVFIDNGIRTGRFSQNYTKEQVLEAFLKAAHSTEEVPLPDIYRAEEFLQIMREQYPQNAPYPFPSQMSPETVAKVLNILL